MAKTSIVFVAGGWHTEFHLKPITPYLESYGYRIVPVKLTTSTSGQSDPPPSIAANVAHIRGILQAEISAGYSVCLVGHSVSGQSVVLAANEFLASASAEESARLVHIVFISCFLNAARATEGLSWFTIDFATMDATVASPYEPFYSGMSAEAAAPFIAALVGNRAEMPPADYGDLWRGVKGTYFLCKNDKAIAPERQRLEAEESGMRVVEVEMDHCPFVSQPEEFAEELNKALQAK
jgi:pimeloyl-ACP methyl ester carboxylesterase